MSLLNTIEFIINHPLIRGNKLSSIIRFARWQVGSRLVPGAIVYDWINGSKFLVKTGEGGLTVNIYTGLHEFPDMGFLLHFLRGNDSLLIWLQMLVHTLFWLVLLLEPEEWPLSQFQALTSGLSRTCLSLIHISEPTRPY